MKTQLPLLFVAVLLIALGCKKSTADVAAPILQWTDFSPQPQSGEICGAIEDSVFVLRGGEQLQLLGTASDDAALSQYKIDIHNNFDCHGHGGSAGPGFSVPGITNQTEDWTVLDIVELSGTSQVIDRALSVPANVTAGNYHFQVQVIDESGNDNFGANFYSLRIYNPADEAPPILSVQQPADGSFSVSKGAAITFSGTVTDEGSLSEGGNGVLFLTYTDLNSGNTFLSNLVVPFGPEVSTLYTFQETFTVPNTLVAGSYRFTLRAHDGRRNVATPIDFEVNVTN